MYQSCLHNCSLTLSLTLSLTDSAPLLSPALPRLVMLVLRVRRRHVPLVRLVRLRAAGTRAHTHAHQQHTYTRACAAAAASCTHTVVAATAKGLAMVAATAGLEIGTDLLAQGEALDLVGFGPARMRAAGVSSGGGGGGGRWGRRGGSGRWGRVRRR
jgi:hypothetical protein